MWRMKLNMEKGKKFLILSTAEELDNNQNSATFQLEVSKL